MWGGVCGGKYYGTSLRVTFCRACGGEYYGTSLRVTFCRACGGEYYGTSLRVTFCRACGGKYYGTSLLVTLCRASGGKYYGTSLRVAFCRACGGKYYGTSLRVTFCRASQKFSFAAFGSWWCQLSFQRIGGSNHSRGYDLSHHSGHARLVCTWCAVYERLAPGCQNDQKSSDDYERPAEGPGASRIRML